MFTGKVRAKNITWIENKIWQTNCTTQKSSRKPDSKEAKGSLGQAEVGWDGRVSGYVSSKGSMENILGCGKEGNCSEETVVILYGT